MATFTDLTGKKFNRLTVIKRVSNKGSSANWHCVCDCGNEIEVVSQSIKEGHTKSCGCLQRETARVSSRRHGGTANYTYHPMYHVWTGLRSRCNNQNHPKFHDYGGRGISVCERWTGAKGFENFVSDMGERPTGFSIDRIDVNGNYTPENCRWADSKTQSNNTRKTINIEIDGVTKSLLEWSEISGKKPLTIRQRISRDKLPPKEAVFGALRHW